jgi:mannose-6-phosphate isomerase-like protein (cupin superfamily)
MGARARRSAAHRGLNDSAPERSSITNTATTLARLARREPDLPTVSRLPGGIGLSHVRVYDSSRPTVRYPETPHVHLVCDELYYVTGGTGAVEFLTPSDGFVRVPLTRGSALQFGPGTVHRLVNAGDLELMIVMQNAGLPEVGDTVFTFPLAVLQDGELYARCSRADDATEALARRDLAVEGLMRAFDGSASEGRAALGHVLAAAVPLVRSHFDDWERWLEAAPAAALAASLTRLERLRQGDVSHLDETAVETFRQAASPEAYHPGTCGMRWPVIPSRG